MPALISNSKNYRNLLVQLKHKIQTAQVRATLAVNQELVLLYWSIGKEILSRQQEHGWGAKIIDQLGKDLRRAFPGMSGFSPRNINYMRAFADAWPTKSIVQQAVAQLPWGHNVRLLDMVKSREERLWYARQTAQHSWSRHILEHQIGTNLYKRQGKAITNFKSTLPKAQSDLAQQLLKDPYNFDFLSLTQEAQEKDLESALIRHISKFLMELGVGFSFVGSQFPLKVGGEEFRIDLLFYHLRLRCYFVIDLKMGAFKPEYAGKLNFYLSAVDNQLRHPDDKRTVGLVLCREKNGIVAQYALQDIRKPLGVSEFRHLEKLPAQLKRTLPSIQDIEAEFAPVAPRPRLRGGVAKGPSAK